MKPRSPKSSAPSRRDPLLELGTTEHYEDALLYDHEYRRRRADVNYYRALAGGRIVPLPGLAPTRRILELGCGSGRLLVPLVRDGFLVHGVDLSGPMLARCQERVDRLPVSVRGRAELERGDFRRLDLGRRFPLILLPFNAMQHLYTREDLEALLAVVKRHLAPGGTFAFDVMNPDLAWLRRDPLKRWARTRFKDPRDGRTYYYSTNHVYDAATQVNHIRIYYDLAPRVPEAGPSSRDLTRRGPVEVSRRGGKGDLTSVERSTGGARRGKAPVANPSESRVVHLAQRQLFPAELADLLHYNGFSLDAREGGFVCEPFESESDSQVCRCSILDASRR